ncbi:MAG: 4Fe-4S binding protein [Proteobacteria bacterium]|nr:4Fe-4S binding protein [Pseudomonadota bacterium]
MLKAFFSNWKRRVAQLVSMGIIGEWTFYGIFRCPFAVPYIGCGNCPVIQCPGRGLWLWTWILIGMSALVFGRVFCGWVCPGGLVSEILSMGPLLKFKINGWISRLLGFVKYVLLGLSLYFYFGLSNPRWAIPIRTGEFFKSVGLTFEHADPIWIYKTVFVLWALCLSVIISMFWCRFLCPTGGALEILSRFSLFRFIMNDKCTDCGLCRKHCFMDTRPSRKNCAQCGECKDVCESEAIEWKRLL